MRRVDEADWSNARQSGEVVMVIPRVWAERRRAWVLVAAV